MIVLGPMDADLSGAPLYWRQGNWRPSSQGATSSACAFTTCPFDKCDLVLEYDARNRENPMPSDQGWDFQGEAADGWAHDPLRGALGISLKEGPASFWSREAELDPAPDRAVAYGLFSIEASSAESKSGGLDFVTWASSEKGRSRGIRGSWTDHWTYRTLDDANFIEVLQPAAEPAIQHAWHHMALDAELLGPDTPGDEFDENDGGKTIASLDGLINHDDRRAFGYRGAVDSRAFATFGKTEGQGPLVGWIRTFFASFSGRFLRAGFRAFALGKITRLRFVFCLEADKEIEPDSAVFLVRYASPSRGLHPASLPTTEASRTVWRFDSSNINRTVEIPFDLERLDPGEELWFTIERDWQHEADRLRSTLHLLMVIVEEGGR